MADSVEIQIHDSLATVDRHQWAACASPEASSGRPNDPFTTYRFLKALEDSGSVGPRTGWQPKYLTAHLGDQMIGAAPLYAKGNSQGEYIFDHNWAHAYEQAGGRYYPKMQMAVPFTPASGRRFLVRPEHAELAQSALVQGAVQFTDNNNLSSLHITFCTKEESDAGTQMGLMPRKSQQFHWVNNDYQDFDAFLTTLSSRKRKNIRKERAQAQSFGGQIHALTGDDIQPEHWDAFWVFYQDTGMRKWGTPYLTREFFDIVQETMRDDVLLALAEIDGNFVAGALNFIGADAVYGRYWGCTMHVPCLHFELCYYQAIDFAISNGMRLVEAGAQGTHKLARGYMPVETHSLHWFRDQGFAKAVAHYLSEEAEAIDEEIEVLTSYGPFRKDHIEEQE
ncbi:MAG: GNAT family N-acetyltransferase [Paracoccaceae bacterium]|nr:GNAT family N-acetyltransferase [Paracoccaceae bacterium]MDG2258092.1 GNAT family N-acetyltransferase [Paracoccaceae bacterium]